MEYNHILTEWNFLREDQFSQPQDAFAGVYNFDKLQDKSVCTTSVIEAFFRDCPPLNPKIKPIPITVGTKSRSSNDIAFGVGLSKPQTRFSQSRNNDHRNVGDSSKSHSAISSLNQTSQSKFQSCSSISDRVKNMSVSSSVVVEKDAQCYLNMDEDMIKSLSHYKVCPKSVLQFHKMFPNSEGIMTAGKAVTDLEPKK